MAELEIRIGDQFAIVPSEPLDCAEYCPEGGGGCPTGPASVLEVTAMQVTPVRRPLVKQIGTICMSKAATEQPPTPPQP